MAEGRVAKAVKEGGGVRGLAESHQALARSVELRSVVIGRRELYGSREAWTSHQQLAALYRRLLLHDLEFALDRSLLSSSLPPSPSSSPPSPPLPPPE